MDRDRQTYVDLGLPSGKLWATENVKIGTKSHFSFDEAVKLFGEHLPSKEDWKELFDNCKCKWEKERKGFTVTGPNGNSIFLPAAGYRYSTGVDDVGSSGNYWSSSVYDADHAYHVNFNGVGLTPQVNHDELTFDKVKQAGAVLVIKHLFKPFKKPKPEFYMRGYHDAAFRLLKLLLRKEVPFILDIENEDDFREETDILRRCSPPLYNKLFPRKEQ